MQPTFEGVSWRALHAAATHCEVVLFTIISGEYDDLSKFVASQRRAHDERDARGRAAHGAWRTRWPMAHDGPWHTRCWPMAHDASVSAAVSLNAHAAYTP